MRDSFPLPDLDWPPTREFWAGCARDELLVPRCDGCGRHVWYPAETCRHCGGRSMTWRATSGRGRLFSWAVVTHPFLPQYADLVPYVTGLVSLEEDPSVRFVTRVVDADAKSLEFDQPLEVTFRTIEFRGVEGSVKAPLFRPSRL